VVCGSALGIDCQVYELGGVMNMDKIGWRPFVWCLLAILLPLAANAFPKIEMTAYVTEVVTEAGLPSVIKVAVVEGEPWEVHIDEFTEVDVALVQYATVTIEAVFAEKEGTDGKVILAREIREDEEAPYEFEGTITAVDDDHNITLIGHQIPVPDEAEIKDASGMVIAITDIKEQLQGRPVTVEGDVLTNGGVDYFRVNEIRILNSAFSCENNSSHVFKAGKSEDGTNKSTEHYCLQSGNRGGSTEISHTDYTGTGVSSYTLGKYKDGERHGFWLTIDVAGAIIQRCRYNNGTLVDGDLSCPV
jgi:hypothetical protein